MRYVMFIILAVFPNFIQSGYRGNRVDQRRYSNLRSIVKNVYKTRVITLKR